MLTFERKLPKGGTQRQDVRGTELAKIRVLERAGWVCVDGDVSPPADPEPIVTDDAVVYTAESLGAMKRKALVAIAKSRGVKDGGVKKDDLIAAILDEQEE